MLIYHGVYVVLQKAAEKTTEAMRSSSAAASIGLENLVAKPGIDHFRSLDSLAVPSLKSVSSSSRVMLGPAAISPQLPFFAQPSSVCTSVRAPSLLSSTYGVTDSAALAAASQKLSLQSKGKPLSVSLSQHEPQPGSLSSAVMPSIQHQLVAGSQSAAFGLINSQLRKAADSGGLAAVLMAPPASSSTATAVRSATAGVPPRAAFPLPSARAVLPPVSSANIGLSTVNSYGVSFASSVPPFSSVSKPVVARLMAQQRLPGVLALSGMPLSFKHWYRYFLQGVAESPLSLPLNKNSCHLAVLSFSPNQGSHKHGKLGIVKEFCTPGKVREKSGNLRHGHGIFYDISHDS